MQRRQTGFTLIELAIVTVVIGILASLIIVGFQKVQQRARDDTRLTQATALNSALKHYFDEHGEYPAPAACSGGSNAVCSAAQDLTPLLVPAYIQAIPDQPNGAPYQYMRGTESGSYGILVQYETMWQCKTGRNMDPSWWGGNSWAPDCPF